MTGFPEPDRGAVRRFVETIFRNATPGTFAALRAFREDIKEPWRPELWSMPAIGSDLQTLAETAADLAWAAAAAPEKVLFAAPLCTFKTRENAAEKNVAEGLAISLELDDHPERGREKAEDLLGPPTLVVKSGGLWLETNTGELQYRRHLHWRLTTPARSFAELIRLKETRRRLALLVGADLSGVPINHPYRWPGTWNRKMDEP